ncbi:hypothetical protein KI387_029584, partial [Taxus chinensis]
MGVISFYRGNLHKVPDTLRRWPIPKPSISLQDFKILLEKRNKALQRLQVNSHEDEDEEVEGMGENGCTKEEDPKTDEENKRKRENSELEDYSERATKCPKINEARQEKGYINLSTECDPQIASKDVRDEGPDFSDSAKSKKSNAEVMDVDVDERITKDAKPTEEAHKNPEEIANKLKRKHELESKLKDLTEEKHHLVQMLKHILSTEEEMKKRSQVAVQTSTMNLSLPSQGETTVDVGSHTKQAGHKIGTELNCYGDLEEGELDDVCIPSPHSQNLHHIHGTTGPLGSMLGRQPNSLHQPSQ